METSKEVALTICEKIQNEYPKRPLWQTMLEIEDLIDKHVASVSSRRELLLAFIKKVNDEFPEENWDYLDFIAERMLGK